jgi:ERF superfamily
MGKCMKKSDSIAQLAKSLSIAQGEMRGAVKDAANPFFKSNYSDLASIIDAIKIPFSKNGLSYVQLTDSTQDGFVSVETVLMHSSGEWISCSLSQKPVKNDAQATGSLVSYLRRYTLQSISGVPSVDDDGNAATGFQAPKAEAPSPAAQRFATVTDSQLKRLHAIASSNHWQNDDVKKLLKEKFNLDSSKNLDRKQYDELCKYLEMNKPDIGNLPM